MKTLFLILAVTVSVSAQTGAGWCANQHWIARSGRIEFVGKWSESQKERFIRVCTKYTHAHADDQKQAKVGDLATVSTIRWGIIIHEDGRIECGQCEGVAAGSVIGKLTPEGIKSVFGSPRSVTPCLTTVTYPGTFTYSPSTTTGPMPSLIAEKPKYAHARTDDPKKEEPKPVAPIRIPAKQSVTLKSIDEEFQANERNYQLAKRDILQRWQIVTQQAAIEAGLTAKQLEGLEVTLGPEGYVWTPKKLAEKPVANTNH